MNPTQRNLAIQNLTPPSRLNTLVQRFPATILTLLALLFGAASSHAQTDTTWTRGAGTADWNNASNWSAGVPVAGFNAIFGANVGGDPNQIITLAMDKITFATGGASHTAQFQNWNVNAAGTFLEVQSGNTQAQTLAATRSGGGTILLKSGTSPILNNGSSSTGLLFGQIVAANAKLTGASGANSTLNVDGSGITTIGIGGTATAANMVISDGSSGGVLSLTKIGSGALSLNSANTFSGGLTLQGAGAINLSHSTAAGTGTVFLKYASSSFVAKTLGISGGIAVANAIQIDSTTGREAIVSSGTGNNSLTGGITITGAGANSIFFANEQSSGNLTVSGGISGASYNNIFSLRGTQAGNVGFLNGAVTLASTAQFDNNGSTSWTLNTAGSTWGTTYIRSSGYLILGVANALATGAAVNFDQVGSTGGIDLSGYNQTVAGLSTSVTPTTGNGGVITNSSATTDSTLTLSGLSANYTYLGMIKDGSAHNVALMMNSAGKTQTLNNANTYTGNTTISAGKLALGASGSLSASSSIVIAAGGTFDVSAIASYTWGASASLTASGNSSGTAATNIVGNTGVSLNSRPATLNFAPTSFTGDATHSALAVSGAGTLNLTGSTVTVNNNGSSSLGAGDYTLISGGKLTGSLPTLDTSTGVGAHTGVAGGAVSLVLSSGNLVLHVASATPTITGAATATAFTTTYGTASANQSFSVSGANLTANLVATVQTTGFEISQDGSTWSSSSVTFAQGGGSASGTLYVRLAATATVSGTYNNQTIVQLSSTGATSQNITAATTGNSVSAAVITITASADSKTYGATKTYGSGSTAYSVTSGSLKNTDAISSVTITDTQSGGPATTVVGAYTLTPSSAVFGTGSAGNYTINYATGTLTINPKSASVTADAKNKTYGADNPPLTATVNGTVNSDTLNYTLATDALKYSAVGVSNIIVTLGSNPNYSVLTTNSTLTINPATPSVTATSSETPSGYHDAVSFLATLPTDATGNVVFSSTNGPISTNALTGGSATSLSITNLPRGTNVITVAYLGDPNYSGSTNTLNQIVTNHPPVLLPLNLTRTAGLGLHFTWSQVTNQWSDTDGDGVTLTSFNLATSNSVTIYTNDTLVGYPSSAPNVADQIIYTASDSYGATVSGVINISVNAYVTGTNSIVNITSGNPTTLKAYGVIGYSYITERSTNMTDWAAIATNTVSTNGVISVSDSFSDLGGQPPSSAFYRIKWQP